MRIVHINNLYPPASFGGAEGHCSELVRFQRAQGHEAFVVTNVRGFTFDDPSVVNLDVPVNPLTTPLLAAQTGVDNALHEALERIAPDVVHVHNVHFTLGFGVYEIASRYPNVATMHDYHLFCLRTDNSRVEGFACNDRRFCSSCARRFYPERAREDFPKRRDLIDAVAVLGVPLFSALPAIRNSGRERKFERWIDAMVCPSSAIKTTMTLWGYPPERMTTIGSMIATPQRRDRKRPDPSGTTFGFIGKLARNKGVRVLIRAFARLPAGSRNRLLFAGGGAERPAIEEAARSIEGVEYLGILQRDAVDAFYDRVDVLAVPSIWPEPMPLVVLEAMARAKALVVADIGGLPEEVGDAGVVVTSNDVVALSDAMARLASDPAEIERLGIAASARFDQYLAPEVVGGQTMELYAKVIEGRR